MASIPTEHRIFYVNARLFKQTALLAGPFNSPEEAEIVEPICKIWFEEDEPRAKVATFGLLAVKLVPGKFPGYGIYNERLKEQGVVIDETSH